MKRENKKVNKENLVEIKGLRTELEPYTGKVIQVEAFITNTYRDTETKRLVNSVRILGTPYYINHAWMRTDRIGAAPHGYRKFKVKVVKYEGLITHEDKYGIIAAEQNLGKKQSNKMVIPKWKRDLDEAEELKMSQKPGESSLKLKKVTVKPFKKMKIVRKA